MANYLESNHHETWVKSANRLILIGIGIVLLAPILFTRSCGLVAFTETGQIGDTIGGTTAPIIGLISAILVFYAFRAQIEANRIVLDQIRKQENEGNLSKNFGNIFTLVSKLEQEIRSFTTVDERKYDPTVGRSNLTMDKEHQGNQSHMYTVTLSGAPAIHHALTYIIGTKWATSLNEVSSDPIYAEIFSILEFFEETINKINNTRLEDNDRILALFLVKQLFISKIEPAFKRLFDKHYPAEAMPNDLFVQKRKHIKKLLSNV